MNGHRGKHFINSKNPMRVRSPQRIRKSRKSGQQDRKVSFSSDSARSKTLIPRPTRASSNGRWPPERRHAQHSRPPTVTEPCHQAQAHRGPLQHWQTAVTPLLRYSDAPMLRCSTSRYPIRCSKPVVHFFFKRRDDFMSFRDDTTISCFRTPCIQCSSHFQQGRLMFGHE